MKLTKVIKKLKHIDNTNILKNMKPLFPPSLINFHSIKKYEVENTKLKKHEVKENMKLKTLS